MFAGDIGDRPHRNNEIYVLIFYYEQNRRNFMCIICCDYNNVLYSVRL